jgi:WD40 repeat protein
MFNVGPIWDALDAAVGTAAAAPTMPSVEPCLRLPAGGGSTAWHLIVSRNGRHLVLNSSDGALRLFKVSDLVALAEATGGGDTSNSSSAQNASPSVIKPLVFQDVVGRAKFACCDLSGDGEYLVGGSNGDDTKYGIHVWNAATGALLDKLTGPPVQLYAVAWHPSRSFVAVATSDGLVDIWGPRLGWTAFAPDFQSLPHNVEYVEDEDELDDTAVASAADLAAAKAAGVVASGSDIEEEEGSVVDVTTVEKVPVFASDSEPEEDAFHYEVRLVNLLAERSRLRGGKEGKGPHLLDTMD